MPPPRQVGGNQEEEIGSGVASSGEGGFCTSVWDKNTNPNSEQPTVLWPLFVLFCFLFFFFFLACVGLGFTYIAPADLVLVLYTRQAGHKLPEVRLPLGLKKVCTTIPGYVSSEE